MFKEFSISPSDIIINQKCKRVTFHVETGKVIGRSKLLFPYAMPALTMDYSTRQLCIQSALLSVRKINRRWCEINTCTLFAMQEMFNSKTFLSRKHQRNKSFG